MDQKWMSIEEIYVPGNEFNELKFGAEIGKNGIKDIIDRVEPL